MTDRIKGLIVTLDHDYRVDDVESIVNLIMSVKGVASVTESVVKYEDHMNRARLAYAVRDKILDLFDDKTLKLD